MKNTNSIILFLKKKYFIYCIVQVINDNLYEIKNVPITPMITVT